MKKDRLIDALGLLDDEMLATVDPSENDVPVTRVKQPATVPEPVGWKRRLVIMLVPVAVMVMIVATVAVATGEFGGRLKTGAKRKMQNGEEYNDHEYEAYGEARVKASEVKGGINKLLEEIPERVKNFSAYDSTLPNCVGRSFERIDEAIDYIGYDKMVFPKLDYPYEGINVSAIGVTRDGSSGFKQGSASDNAEYVLGDVILDVTQKYHSDPDYWFQTAAYLPTEYSSRENNAIYMGYSDRAKFTSEEKAVKGRTFSILRETDPSFAEGNQDKIEVYWQENGVFYVFHIVFCEELRAEAERIAQEWMESFP